MPLSYLSGCRKRWATFIGGLASFDVIFSTVGRRTVVGGARVVRRRPAGRSAGRPGGARVVSGAEKSFDRGGPVWPPRSNVTNDRLRGGSGEAFPPQPKPKKFRKNAKIYVYTFICLCKVLTVRW